MNDEWRELPCHKNKTRGINIAKKKKNCLSIKLQVLSTQSILLPIFPKLIKKSIGKFNLFQWQTVARNLRQKCVNKFANLLQFSVTLAPDI